MNLLLADTFNDALAKLTPDEQKTSKLTVFDFQLSPENPGHRFHRIERAKDKDFWSVRVNRDLRLIVHKRGNNLLVCYVAHHDDAYQWAQNRRLENHPKTGVAQIVQIRETIRDIEIPNYILGEPEAAPAPANEVEKTKAPRVFPFKKYDDDALLEWGVPTDWLDDVRQSDDRQLLDLVTHLPAEAADALLELATGGQPSKAEPAATDEEAFTHPDAQRRFQLIKSDKELEAALEFPWDKWSVFLHPDQRKIVEKSHSGPVRVSGSAGTGKTIVALHRAVWLARENPDSRVLLTTFSPNLARALENKLKILVYSEPSLIERISVESLASLAKRLHRNMLLNTNRIARAEEINDFFANAYEDATEEQQRFKLRFFQEEWHNIIDAHQIKSQNDFRSVSRLGRKSRLTETQRDSIWPIFENVLNQLNTVGLVTQEEAYTNLALELKNRTHPPFDYAIIDEAQDLSVSQLKFFSALGNGSPESLFFAGDIGQRIFQAPFSWLSLGIDIRGRSSTLKVNYRTSHQIREYSDRLLDRELEDPDGIRESRRHTISVFNGPSPKIAILPDLEAEKAAVQTWLTAQKQLGIQDHETAIFVRSEDQIPRATEMIENSDFVPKIITMHDAKGLEFRSVAIVACDQEIMPLEERIQSASDMNEIESLLETERHLLYVACTRARENLLITAQSPGSEFLADLTTTSSK